MLLAVAVHVAVRPVRVDVVLSAIAVLWASMMARAGSRRPSDSACALWADRHLGGASAFSTLLEMSDGTRAVPRPQGLRWLERWATARVPHSLRLLEQRRDPARLSRPFLSMLVCAAFATLVLTLPDLAPSSRQQLAASTPSGIAEQPAPGTEPTVTAELVAELANVLRSAESRRTSDRRDIGGAPAPGPGKSDDGTGSRVAAIRSRDARRTDDSESRFRATPSTQRPRPEQHRLPGQVRVATPATALTTAPTLVLRESFGVRCR